MHHMYDMSNRFNTFYGSHVVLSQDEQNKLHEKKRLNIRRLKDGLSEYNEEHRTSYRLVETCVQGSVAMSTVVQNESSDYDIDVAVVFDKEDIGNLGPRAMRNVVADALRRKTKAFNAEPEVKTSCVRVKYADGYHIDFAVFRRESSNQGCVYEHAGAEWSKRSLRGLNDWFKERNSASDDKLRKVVRLSKMFCSSRDSWVNMPSGIVQTVVCDERLQESYDSIDELFYHTMKEVVSRIEASTDVSAPVDNGRPLAARKSDKKGLVNWKNRLKSKLEDLDVLFEDDCTEDDALQAWYGFFNHDFWNVETQDSRPARLRSITSDGRKFRDTEQFIEDMFDYDPRYTIRVDCTVSGDGFRPGPLKSYLGRLRRFLPHHFEIKCNVDTEATDVPGPYEVYWKVKNVGPEAERRDCIRGQIEKRGFQITENTLFYGMHYIECYAIKGGCCVARARIDVPIGR